MIGSREHGEQELVRSLSLAHAVLYGLGVTIGAGIYVLVGVMASRSGMHAPLAFIVAVVPMALSAASFAELGTRMPVSASEAAYVQAAFGPMDQPGGRAACCRHRDDLCRYDR